MDYFDRVVPKARTIETLEISDILEIVGRDLKRYNVPDDEIVDFYTEHVFPLERASDKLILKYRLNFKVNATFSK